MLKSIVWHLLSRSGNEDKRVRNQLELAARKLAALQDLHEPRASRPQDIPMVHLSKHSNGMMWVLFIYLRILLGFEWFDFFPLVSYKTHSSLFQTITLTFLKPLKNMISQKEIREVRKLFIL